MSIQNSSSPWMTLQEACDYWRVSKSTARRIIKAEGIQRHAVGAGRNIIVYKREDIESVIQPLETIEK